MKSFKSSNNKYVALSKSLHYLVKQLVKSGISPERIVINLNDFPGASVSVFEQAMRCDYCDTIMDKVSEDVDLDDELRRSRGYVCPNCKSTLHTEFAPRHKQ